MQMLCHDSKLKAMCDVPLMLCSGGNGGGETTLSTTFFCRPGPIYCFNLGPVVVAGGGTSFASSLVSSAVFQLGPQVVPPSAGLTYPPVITPGAGYVQVARLG